MKIKIGLAVGVMLLAAVIGSQAAAGAETESIEAAKAILEFEQKQKPDQNLSWDEFVKNYQVSKGKVVKADVEAFVAHAGRDTEKLRSQTEKETGFLGLKIRSDYSDVLSSEDPTVSLEGKDTVQSSTDLKGASFSYERDFKASSDNWAAKGAALFPFIGRTNATPHLGDPMTLTTYGVIPSISFDRETNSADESKNVDSLIFRVGLFAKFMSGGVIRAQTFRVFGSYGTDFEFRSQTPAAEFEYEPVIFLNRRLGTGSTHSLYEKHTDTGVETILAYQLRAYLHGEYGRVVDHGDKTNLPEDDFFRVGPKLELTLDPLLTDRLTASVGYEYLANVTGTTIQNHLFTVSGEFRITTKEQVKKNPLIPLVSLKVTYEDGGIDLTKEPVRTLLVGLGVTL